MRYQFSLPALALLAACATPASADTMYKCVDSAGKVAYTSMPCPGKTSTAKAFTVDAPLDSKAQAEADMNRLQQLNEVKAGIARREAERRQAEYTPPSGYGVYTGPTPYNGPGGVMRSPDKVKPAPKERSAEQIERDLQRARRENYCGRNPNARNC